MRNLKKVLALVVAVAMIASMGLVASAASYTDVASNASYADAVNLLSNLGIITGYEDGTFRPDNTVTRAEAATMIVRMLNLDDEVEQGDTNFTDVAADNWASGYVNVAEANGIINGMGDGTFNPNGEVTYGQIVKMIVCALGYEPVALANGGYNGGGYLYAGSAQVTGFTKGVAGTANGAASRATVARLIYNALEVELMEQDSFSTGINGSEYSVQENKTILSEYLELEKVDGVIVNTYLSTPTYEEGSNTVELVVTKNYSEGKIAYEVDEKYSLVAEGTDAATLLGYTVVAYVGENEDGDDAVFAVAEKSGKNSVVVLDTELVAENGFSAEEIEYYKSESSRSTTTAEIQAYIGKNAEDGVEVENNVVINGFNDAEYVGSFDATVFDAVNNGQLEEVTLLDNDNDGDFEFIFATIPSDNAVEFVVEATDAEDWYVEGEDEDFNFEYDDEDKLYTIVKDGQIVEFDAIAEGDVVTVLDKDVNVITVNVSSVVVEGTVDEVDDEVYTINGAEYELSPISYDEDDALEAGDEGLFYINASGKIAYVDTVNSVAGADYVYVIDAEEDDSNAFSDTEYLVQVVTAAGAVEVLTIKSKKVDVIVDVDDDNNVLDVTAKDAYDEIVKMIDDDGVLAKIDTTAAGEISAIYFAGAEDFVEEDRYANDANDEVKSYNESRGTYGSVDLSADTLVFDISDDEDEDLVDRITVTTVGNLFVDESSYSFKAYGAEDEAADVLVATGANTSVDAEAPVMIVTKISDVVSDDEDTIKITGKVAGSTVAVIVDPDEVNEIDVEVGNVILYAEGVEYVTDVQVLNASTDEEVVAGAIAGGDIVSVPSEDAVSVHYGVIEDSKAKSFTIEGYEEPFYFGDDCIVTVVDYRYNNVEISTGRTSSVKASNDDDVEKAAFVKTTLDSADEAAEVIVFIYNK